MMRARAPRGGREAGGPVGDAELLEEAHGAPVVEGGFFEPGLAVEDGGDGAAEDAVDGVADVGGAEAARDHFGMGHVAGFGVGGEHLAGHLGITGLVGADETQLVAAKDGDEAEEQGEEADGEHDDELAGRVSGRKLDVVPAEPGYGCAFSRRAWGGELLDIVHSIKRSETRLTESRSELRQNSISGDVEGAIESAPAGTAMTAAAEGLGDLSYIDFTFAADAETELAGRGKLAEEDSGLDAVDADEVVNDAFAVLDFGAGGIHVLIGDPGPREGAIGLEVGESCAEQADLAGRIGEVDVTGDLAGVCAAGGEVVGEGEGFGVGAGVGEGACVGEDGGVEAGGHAGGDLDVGGYGDAVDHGGDGAGVLVDPVEIGEVAAAGVMVDVDEATVIEAEESGALDAVALEEDGRDAGVGNDVGDRGGVMDAFDVGEGAVDEGDRVGEDDVGLAA